MNMNLPTLLIQNAKFRANMRTTFFGFRRQSVADDGIRRKTDSNNASNNKLQF